MPPEDDAGFQLKTIKTISYLAYNKYLSDSAGMTGCYGISIISDNIAVGTIVHVGKKLFG
jgi:hypothetical protein